MRHDVDDQRRLGQRHAAGESRRAAVAPTARPLAGHTHADRRAGWCDTPRPGRSDRSDRCDRLPCRSRVTAMGNSAPDGAAQARQDLRRRRRDATPPPSRRAAPGADRRRDVSRSSSPSRSVISSKTASATGPAGVAHAMSSGTGSKPSTRRCLEEAADLVMRRRAIRRAGCAPVRQALGDEGGAFGGKRIEGVRFVHEAGNGDAHRHTSLRENAKEPTSVVYGLRRRFLTSCAKTLS